MRVWYRYAYMDDEARKPKQGEFFKMPWAIAIRTDISPLAKLVFAYLFDAMRGKDACWPSIRTIAKGTSKVMGLGLHRDRVVKAVHDLSAKGLLIVEGGRPGHVQSNRYRFPGTVRESVTVRKMAPPKTVREICATVRETGTEPSGKAVHNQSKSKNQSKKNRSRSDPEPDSWEAVEKLLPAGAPLRNHRFRGVWESWAAYRREIRKKLTESTVRGQLKKWAKWADKHGLDEVVTAIERSIEKGWTGVFEPREESKHGIRQTANPARVITDPADIARVKSIQCGRPG